MRSNVSKSGWSGSEPALQGLVKALGLALGLRGSGGSVFLADAEEREDVFEGVATAGEAGGIDAAVVAQRAGGSAVVVCGRKEDRDASDEEDARSDVEGTRADGRSPSQEPRE